MNLKNMNTMLAVTMSLGTLWANHAFACERICERGTNGKPICWCEDPEPKPKPKPTPAPAPTPPPVTIDSPDHPEYQSLADAPGMAILPFIDLSKRDLSRCSGAVAREKCERFLNRALIDQKISSKSHKWGWNNNYYPVLDMDGEIAAVCACGCFEANTRILVSFEDDPDYAWMKIRDMDGSSQVAALSADATLESLDLMTFGLSKFIHGPEETPLHVFHLSNGKVLKLTQNHGVLVSDGRMIAAKDVTVSDKLLSVHDGKEVSIQEITRENTTEDVYNFEVKGTSNLDHIVGAEGVFVGDLAWQNNLASELGEIQVRK